jgi:CO dehydrogenase maturation factor
MKIAIAGKGGAGKTTISGTLCRLLGQSGVKILAIDGDPNPNLSVVLGISRDTPPPPALSTDVLERVEDPDGKRRIQLKVPLNEVIHKYGQSAPDNITLLMVGQPEHAGTGCMCGSHTAVREIIHAAMAEGKEVTVLDMEASMEHMKRGTSKYVDAMFTVVEPYYRSLEAAGRFHRLAKELGVAKIAAIANKVRNTEEEAAIRQYCERIGLPVAAVIPFDERVTEADLRGQAIIDYAGDAPVVQSLKALVEQLRLS